MISDLIVALRGLRRSPAFTLAALVTLALGIGANTAMFSVVNTVLLRPLPGYRTDRIVHIVQTRREGHGYVSPGLYLRLRETLQSFAPIAANQNCRMNLTGQGEPEQLAGPCTTANWFELQRAQAILGRTFLPDEDQQRRNRVIVLDHAFWRRRFGGDRGIIGRKILLDGEPWVVIGVMPAGFEPAGTGSWPVYTPYVVADNPHGLNVTARMKQGVSLAAAQAELDVAASRLAKENPDWKDVKLAAVPVLEQLTGEHRSLLLLLLGAVSFVLLIACVNVAGLLLARSAARRHEIGIRIALGASRRHIARFVFAESLAIAVPASGMALAVAYGGLRLLAPLTHRLPRASELAIDAHVLGWSLLARLIAALLSGILPALQSSAPRARNTGRPQSWLAAGEIALASVLVVGAALMLQSFAAIRSKDLGYDPRNVLTSFLALPASPDGTRTAGVAVFQRIRERVSALPGVRGVATASSIPMFGVSMSMDVHPEGEPERRHEHVASMTVIGGDYFGVMGIPVPAGRRFTVDDRQGSTPVAIISASIAARYFAGEATGKRILIPELKYNIDGGKDLAAEIVGVAGNVCVNSVEDCEAEHIYLPETQNALRMENLLVGAWGDPRGMLAAVRHALYEEAPTVPLDDPLTLEERTAYLSDQPRRAMWLLSVFAVLAMALAAVGVYGLSAHLAACRRREIGIRMALGATPGDIARLILGKVLAPSLFGLAMGAAAAAGLTRLLKSMLAGVSPHDPGTLVLAAILLFAASVAAAALPVLSATRTNPAEVLRGE